MTDIAIIGDGVASLITFALLRQAGWPAEAITVYGDQPQPLARLQAYAHALAQDRMRSESNGHLHPVDFPGLALLDAYRHRSLKPLLASLFDLYHPSLDLFLTHAHSVAAAFDFSQRHCSARVTSVCRGGAGYAINEKDSQCIALAHHLILALGHPGFAWPLGVEHLLPNSQISHAYQAQSYHPGEKVVVIGSGMAAAHVWLAALKAGAVVTVLHRQPIQHQKFTAPRCSFSAANIQAYQRLTPSERVVYLQQAARGTFPWHLDWEWALLRARRKNRLAFCPGAFVNIEQTSAGLLKLYLDNGRTLHADRIVCATGFIRDQRAHPLIAQLVADYRLPTFNGLLMPADDFSLLPLSESENLCGVVGVLARWALPVADSFAGMKYAARRLTRSLRP